MVKAEVTSINPAFGVPIPPGVTLDDERDGPGCGAGSGIGSSGLILPTSAVRRARTR